MSKPDEPLTKVHVDLPNHWATGGEAMWAKILGPNTYQLDNVPFFAYDLNYGDVVEAIEQSPERKPSVIRVIRRSGHRTLRIFFNEELSREQQLEHLNSLDDLKVSHERKDARFVALDLEPESDMGVVRARLDAWEAQGIADYETCEARVPGSFDGAPDDGAAAV